MNPTDSRMDTRGAYADGFADGFVDGFVDGFADGFVDGFVDMEAGHQRRRVASPYERKRNEWERA